MAQSYGVYGQITGKEIIPGVNIIESIDLGKQQYVSEVNIHTDWTREVIINGSSFYIDEKQTFNFSGVKIDSIKFPINKSWPIDDNTVITFAIEEKEVY